MSKLMKQIKQQEAIREKFSYLEDELLDILEGMLKFNPEERSTIKECL